VVDCRSERLTVARDIHKSGLDRWRECGCAEPNQKDEEEQTERPSGSERESDHGQREHAERHEQSPHNVVVRGSTTEQIPDGHAEA